jgi:carboxymethylenebutenolidase
MIASISDAAVMRDTAVVIQALDRFSGVRPGAMGAVGYCMGGGFAVSAAGTFPDRVAVATSFHGGGLAVDRRDSPHLLASRIKARIYIGAAGVDPSFTDDQQHRLEKSLDEAGVNYTLERYPDARHGFAVTAHPAYDRVASERHWSVLAEELQAALSPQT